MKDTPRGVIPAAPSFDRSFDGLPGVPQSLTPFVTRLVAGNGGPFTFHGTNTYILGIEELAIVDPGPADGKHLSAILDAVAGRPVSAIMVTHTHMDHSPLSRALKEQTGAPIVGADVHRPARDLADGEVNPLDAANDMEHTPDRVMVDGDRLAVDGATLTAIATPGHTANHLCFRIEDDDPECNNTMLTGDHVMAWSTSIVAAPDGDMRAYMASLARLATAPPLRCWPGHGGTVNDPASFIPALIEHRRARETALLEALAYLGPATIPALVQIVYKGLAASLQGAAALSLHAHAEALVAEGRLATEAEPTLTATYRLTA
ncbi:MAG: MBL fold metallo-hydrolase [Pseudomonadota bacterium]